MLLLSFLFACFASCDDAPFLIFDKKVVEEYGKVNEPVHLMYQIFNTGSAAATDIHVDDAGIPLEQWEFNEAASNLRWDTIEAGQNVTHVFEVKPLVTGNLRMTPSRLTYFFNGQKKIILSAPIFWWESRSSRSIGAKGNLQGYALTIVISLALIFIPYLMWILNKTKPAAQKPKSN